MRLLLISLSAITLAVLTVIILAPTRTASAGTNVFNPPAAGCAPSLDDCPVEGCTSNNRPFDPLLNQQKNITDLAQNAQPQSMSLNDIKDLVEYEEWPDGTDRAELTEEGEGRPVRIKGYLWKVKSEGAETCNCELTGARNTDMHLVIVQHSNDPENKSVTAEITPRIKRTHTDWTFADVKRLEGHLLRITGWLMYDSKHVGNPLVRATNWEVHPITKLEVRRGNHWEVID